MELEFIGIKAAKKAQLAAKGIYRIEDLLNYLPKAYKDCREITGLLDESRYSVILADIDSCRYIAKRPDTKTDVIMVSGREVSSGAAVKVCWFSQVHKYSALKLCVNKRVLIAGKFRYDPMRGEYSVSAPDIFTADIHSATKLYPEYKKIPRMSLEYLTEKIEFALRTAAVDNEPLPPDILKKYGLLSMPEAYRCIHRPQSDDDVRQGERRVLYNDLIYFALRREWASRDAVAGSQYGIKSLSLYKKILSSFPYALTGDQQRVVSSMTAQIKDRRRLHTLIQGDVGSGKTICAFLMAAAFIGSGYQAVLMAPTQVLAEQHYEDAVKLFEPFGVKTVILNSKMKAAEKREKLKAIESGSVSLIIGTHSVFGKDVHYKALALTIADEEHRFGVAQRTALVAKAAEGCHSITMSATPIPRTIAQSIYGDTIDVQEIKGKPAGRLPVKTYIRHISHRHEIYESVERQLTKGHQTYIICPKIEKGEDTAGLISVEETADAYREYFEDKGYTVAALTGKTSEEETQRILGEFNAGTIHILVSTTVVEVGVNVPNATVMVISNAERFGLSGLHQLRGRVGRGSAQGYCILEYVNKTDKAEERLRTIKNNTDGYLIALEDLKQRGAGDLIGTQQHGENKYVSLMLMYKEDYDVACRIACELLDTDADCEMVAALKREMQEAD